MTANPGPIAAYCRDAEWFSDCHGATYVPAYLGRVVLQRLLHVLTPLIAAVLDRHLRASLSDLFVFDRLVSSFSMFANERSSATLSSGGLTHSSI